MVRIEKGQLEICDRLADELNRSAKKFKQTSYKANTSKYEGILARKDISVEQKKKLAAKNIHELAVKSFSIEPSIQFLSLVSSCRSGSFIE